MKASFNREVSGGPTPHRCAINPALRAMPKVFVAAIATLAVIFCSMRAVDAAAFHLTFDDECNAASLSNLDLNGDQGTIQPGTYETWFRSYPARYLQSGEIEEYVDPFFWGLPNSGASLNINPFSASGGQVTLTGAPSSRAQYLEGHSYTSGLLTTFSSFSQTYGYFECRAKLPPGPGLWPAFWLLPTAVDGFGNVQWKSELDVMECFGNTTPNFEGGANQVHWASHDSGVGINAGNWAAIPGNIYTGYHTYGLNWQSDYTTFYVDGLQIGQSPTQADMRQPMFLLANLALGGAGSWPGAVDPNSGEFPAKMNIDYIRAFSSDPNAPAAAPMSGYSPNTTLPILTLASTAGPINLSTVGTVDWSHWGGTATNISTAQDHKSNLISNYTMLAGTATGYSGNPTAFDWTGSTGPNPTANDTQGNGTGVSAAGVNSGFQFYVTTASAPLTLNLYVGASHAQGLLSVYNSVGSLVYSDSSVNNTTGPMANSVYTVSLQPGANNTSTWYTFQWTVASGTGSISLQAATLTGMTNTSAPNGNYTLTASCAPACRMNAAGSGTTNGTLVQSSTANGGSAQTWVFTNLGGNVFLIQPSYAMNMALDASGTANGSNVDLYQVNGSTTEQWTITYLRDGTCQISPVSAPSTVISVNGNSSSSGAQLVLWTPGGGSGQVWTLNAVTGPPAPPTGLTATPGNAQIILNWNATSGATTYNVKRSTISGSGYVTVSSPATTSYTNTGLTNGTTYYYIVSAVNSGGESGNSTQVSAVPSGGAALPIQINAGGPAVSPFVADVDFSGGGTATNWTGAITTTGVASPAPQAVYQSERYGTCTYTISGLTSGTSYTVRLHFCENYFTASGQRTFTVAINGTNVLTNFDIYAATGAPHKANVQQFAATANGSGQIVIAFTNVTNNALINGLEVLAAAAPPAPTGLTAVPGNAQAALAWNASTGATSYTVLRSTVNGSGYAWAATGVAATSYTDTGLTNGTMYYYVVQGLNAGGGSAYSNQAAAKPVLVPTFVQVNSNDPVSAQTIQVAYGTQTAGNLNIVVVGWNDTTSTVSSVVDSAGNTYTLAVGPTTGGGQRQSIYYAKNIKGGSNTVTVTMSTTVSYPDIRVSEYTGVGALDVTAGAFGTSTTPNSGSAATTTARELIFSANTCYPSTTAPGSGFTTRVTTIDGDITEDKSVTATGSYSGSATLNSSNFWVMQMATFK